MIYLPPPQPALNSEIRISGNVEIHSTASLAPGVILQASPGFSIVIGADVCIGMGTIINAGNGSVEIESGATLGSGVLVIGKSKIGSNACIGTATTIFQSSVVKMAVISPGSIIGDRSRSLEIPEISADANQNSENRDKTKPLHSPEKIPNNNGKSTVENQQKTQQLSDKTPNTVKGKQPEKPESVVGKVYIDQLLVTLFPHRTAINSQEEIDEEDKE